MFTHSLSPVFLSLGNFTIFWYGLLFFIGTGLAIIITKKRLVENEILTKKQADNLLFLLVIAMLVGARIGSVISEFSFYLENPLSIFAIWSGGLAFHGGLVGSIIACWWFAKKHNVELLKVADVILFVIPLSLALGRIGNFINAEFYGTVTTLPWGVLFPSVATTRHPVQLYESLAYLLLFALLFFVSRRPTASGVLTASFFIGYSIIRFSLEYVKDVSPLLFTLTWGQIWSIPMLFFGIYLLRNISFKKGATLPEICKKKE